MTKQVSREVFATMRKEGMRQYPNEACGLIVCVGKNKTVAVPCKNSHEKPLDNFRISKGDYAECSKLGEIIGVWHTHTDEPPNPSDIDRAACEEYGLPWYIVGITKNKDDFAIEGPTLLEPCGYIADYVGRPYVFGIHDCYSLVCDYYKREFGIQLKRDYPRIDEWWKKGYDFFSENFQNEDFVPLIDAEHQVGDLLIIQSGASVGSHIAIYVGNDTILHHCYGRLSCHDIYGGHWHKHTIHHIRHKSKC